MKDLQKKAKFKVLDDLMSAMDDKMLGEMKAKSPKFAKVDVKTNDPDPADNLQEKLADDAEPEAEGSHEDAAAEIEEEPSDEEKAKIRELYMKYCR